MLSHICVGSFSQTSASEIEINTQQSNFQLSVAKPKPKLLLWAITTDADNPMNQLERKANT